MILLAGFEPFGGDTLNPSWPAARGAACLLRAAGTDAAAVELPCTFAGAGPALAAALAAHRPSVVVAAGLAGGRAAVSLERIAINVNDARIPDNSGHQPVDEPVVADGPAAYFSTLPIKASLAALCREGLPAEVSNTAGTFVCNQLFYLLMHLLSRPEWSGIRGGFVHVPYAPEQVAAGGGMPSLDADLAARAVAVIARTALDVETDLRIGAGALH